MKDIILTLVSFAILAIIFQLAGAITVSVVFDNGQEHLETQVSLDNGHFCSGQFMDQCCIKYKGCGQSIGNSSFNFDYDSTMLSYDESFTSTNRETAWSNQLLNGDIKSNIVSNGGIKS